MCDYRKKAYFLTHYRGRVVEDLQEGKCCNKKIYV